jgi:hypothetical protein
MEKATDLTPVVYSDLQQYDGTWRFLPEHEDWWERIEL